MTISLSEPNTFICPSCDQQFTADVWTLVDATERPDLAQALRDGALEHITCPHCGAVSTAGVALLFHDPAQRRVYFAVPPNVAEYRWRERAQELLQTLLSAVPEEEQQPYFGDVQVEQEVEGVRRAVLRRDRRDRARQASATSGQTSVDQMREQLERRTGVRSQEPENAQQETSDANQASTRDTQPSVPDLQPSEPEVTQDDAFEAIQELLAADTTEQFRAIVVARPVLLSDIADTMFAQLANTAYEEGDRSLAEALHSARRSLQRMRQLDVEAISIAPADAIIPADLPQTDLDDATPITSAMHVLFHATTTADLIQALDDYPVLLTPEVDAELAARAELALEEGNERLARQIEERREALIELRTATPEGSALMQAIEALLTAEDEAAMQRTIADYPMLLSDEAQQTLSTLAATTRAQGDTALADYATECQTWLKHARRQP